MKILILGALGQLGWELVRRAPRYKFKVQAMDLPEFDITDQTAVNEWIGAANATVVVNACAYTAVDKAESEPRIAFDVNAAGPRYLAMSCRDNRLPLIHVSTDYVFDGTGTRAYKETDPPRPMGVYGRSKAAGEANVRDLLAEHIILRTAWLYGVHGHNFVKTMLKVGRENEVVKVVSDQRGCPTYAADLAEAILKICAQIVQDHPNPWGTYHFAGQGATSWHGFAKAVFELAAPFMALRVGRVDPISTSAYPTPAQRPANSVLDCTQLTQRFGIEPQPWRERLEAMINCLFENQASDQTQRF